MNRRRLLTAAAAAPLLAVPALAGATYNAGTPIMALYRRWLAHQDAMERMDDEAFDAAFDVKSAMEREAESTPCRNATDFVAKIVILTAFGQEGINDETRSPLLWAEARALVSGEI